MEVEEFLKEAAVMKEIKHPNLVQLLGEWNALLFVFLLSLHFGRNLPGLNAVAAFLYLYNFINQVRL